MARPRTRSASHNADAHETASVQQAGPSNQPTIPDVGIAAQDQAPVVTRIEFNDLMRELRESRRQLGEQMQANANLMAQLTQQQQQNAGGNPAPYSSSDSSTSSDEPPRRRRRKTEAARTGAAIQTAGNRDQVRAGNLGTGVQMEAGGPDHQNTNEVEPQDARLADRQERRHQHGQSRRTDSNLPPSIQTPDLTAMVRQLMKENQGLSNDD